MSELGEKYLALLDAKLFPSIVEHFQGFDDECVGFVATRLKKVL